MKDRVSSDPPQGQQNFARMALKNKTFSFFKTPPTIENTTKNSYHPHTKLTRIKKNKEKVKEFFKFNRPNSYMSYLEAGAWQIASFLAPQALPPKVKAIVDNNGAYVGVSSQSIPFKSSHEEPLTLDDLKIPVFEALKLQFPDLENDWEIVMNPFEKELSQLIQECEEIEEWLITFPEKINGLKNEDLIPYPNNTKLTVLDIKRFHIVRRQAELWTGVYFRKDNDPHANNVGKEYNIDFDESFWPFFSSIKDSSCGVDGKCKQPYPHAFDYTPADITHLPNTQTFKPHHLCTKTPGVLHSENAFTAEQNKVYAQLEYHPVFIYYKCVYLLKVTLLTREMIRSLLALHIPVDDIFKEENFLAHDWSRAEPYAHKNVLDTFTKVVANCVLEMKTALLETPQYIEFLKTCGQHEMNKYLDHLAQYNKKLNQRIDTQASHILERPSVKQAYLSILSSAVGSLWSSWNQVNNTTQDLADRPQKKIQAYTELLINLNTQQKIFSMRCKGLIADHAYDFNKIEILEEYVGQQKNPGSQDDVSIIEILEEYAGQQKEQAQQQTHFRPK